MNADEQYAYLLQDGDLSVPCSRWGSTTATCARFALLVARAEEYETGEETSREALDSYMRAIVNDSDEVIHLLKHYGSEEQHYAARTQIIWQVGQEEYDACSAGCDICNRTATDKGL